MRTPWPVLLLFLALLLPAETGYHIGDLWITWYRVLLLGMFIPCAVMLASGRAGKWTLADGLVIVWVSWAAITFAYHHGPEIAAQSGGIYVVEGVGAYLIARCFIRDLAAFRAMVALLTAVVIAMLVVTVPEAVTGRNFIREVLAGYTPSIGERWGMKRSYGMFQHPILLGVFCCSAVGLSYFVLTHDDKLRTPRVARTVLVTLSTFASFSAGPLSAVVVQFGIIGWDRFTTTLRNRWWYLLALFAFFYVVIDVLSNRSPLLVFIDYASFTLHSAYNRVIIWEWGTASVMNHPMFGIGFNEWVRPSWMHSTSMDNFWLLVAVRHGLPAIIALLGAVAYTIWRLTRLEGIDPMHHRARLGWITTMLGLFVVGLSVHFWDHVFVLFAFLLGSIMWMLCQPLDTSTETKNKRRRPMVKSA
ncbi:O-antigen ligase family protein [Phycisphaerales bacterium AB-hyl4]|uniref:O-antigen ligase family protein n=1 Tax=Natronomicrosphaera hydrolytica TaxID=3242702 RepID=A0ABV4U7G1_9BACT